MSELWESNDALSMARAQRVAQVLADNGVNGNRISIDGRGDRELRRESDGIAWFCALYSGRFTDLKRPCFCAAGQEWSVKDADTI